MTEIELNEKIAELQSEPSILPKRKTGRAYRREMKARKNERRYKISFFCYKSSIGYAKGFYDGPQITHSGSYLKYPKNSKRQKCYKRLANKKIRQYPVFPTKGAYYCRIFEYWWILC